MKNVTSSKRKLTLQIVFGVAVILSAAFCVFAQQAQPAAEITYTYNRLGGMGSNQFAVWVEDARGQYVKTLFVTRWTTGEGHAARRPTSIPMWVARSNLANTSRAQIDAISSATPRGGAMTHTWDGTNSAGVRVPDGDYVIVVEGTLRMANQVYYRAPITIGGGAKAAQVSVEYVGDAAANDRSMIADVAVRTLR